MNAPSLVTTGITRTSGDAFALPNAALAALMLDTLSKNAKFRFQAKGSSMWPWIKNGDILTIAPLPPSGPRLGDVVPFRNHSNKLVVHRIVGKQRGQYLISADNASSVDGLFHPDALYGRLTAIERNLRPVLFGLGPERGVVALMTRLRMMLKGNGDNFEL